jgi:asparagine synthase (glutamine-hydrolysing)
MDHSYPSADLDSVLKHSIGRVPLPLYLRIEDRNSMAHSVEVRLPYLDYRLVSLILNLPAEWKLRGPWTKFVLREGMRGRIPEAVRCRVDKMGFPVPTSKWLRAELFEPMMDVLGSQAARERGLYNTGEIRRDAERFRRGELQVSSKLFDVTQTELWFQLSFQSGGIRHTTPTDESGNLALANGKLAR